MFSLRIGLNDAVARRFSAASQSAYNKMTACRATADDADAIAAIYNEGIEEGLATFETRLRAPNDVRKWFGPRFPIVVIEDGGYELSFLL